MSRRGILSTKPKAIGVCLPIEMWPEADQKLWLKARSGDVLEDGGLGKNWASATATKYVRDYGRWLAWIRRKEPAALMVPPLQRLSKERIKVYVADLQTTVAPYSVASFLRGIGSVAWAFSESDDYTWIVRFAGRLNSRAVSVKNKRQIMRPSDELVSLGLRLMAEAKTQPVGYSSAIIFRNGLIIALLAYRPLRRRNICGIAIGRHLAISDAGCVLRFDANETKQRRAMEVPVPDNLIEALHSYIDIYRPVLLARPPFAGAAGNALWVANDGGPLLEWGFYTAVRNTTGKAFGHPHNPHLFRDSAATTVALDNPSQIAIVPDVLGHSNPLTSARYYNQARCIDASRRYQDHLKRMRRRPKCSRLSSTT